MRVNEDTAISTPKVTLVPYESSHVAKYHRWMSDPDIQAATASEPLSLEEEYENQVSWRTSHDKLTFIICKPHNHGDAGADDAAASKASRDGHQVAVAGDVDREDKMVGDVNFFLYPSDNNEDDEDGHRDGLENKASSRNDLVGEIDVMIAEIGDRGKGVGFAAVTAMMTYVYRHLDAILEEHGVGSQSQGSGNGPGSARNDASPVSPPPPSSSRLRGLMVKIQQDNTKSAALFRRAGFVQKGVVNYFGEIELVLDDFVRFMSSAPAEDGGQASWRREARDGFQYREMIYARGSPY